MFNQFNFLDTHRITQDASEIRRKANNLHLKANAETNVYRRNLTNVIENYGF